MIDQAMTPPAAPDADLTLQRRRLYGLIWSALVACFAAGVAVVTGHHEFGAGILGGLAIVSLVRGYAEVRTNVR